jgi:hypothetical protein
MRLKAIQSFARTPVLVPFCHHDRHGYQDMRDWREARLIVQKRKLCCVKRWCHGDVPLNCIDTILKISTITRYNKPVMRDTK